MSGDATKSDSAHLAADRTWLAHERTLMAWVRTAVSMISFGFSIYKFFQFEAGERPATRGLITPRDFAIVLIGIALVTLSAATISHRRNVRGLTAYLGGRRSMAQLVAVLVALLGFAVLLAAYYHA